MFKFCKAVYVSPLNRYFLVISESKLLHFIDEEIVENQAEKWVIDVRRIQIYHQDEQIDAKKIQIPTKHINSPNLPNSIKGFFFHLQ